MRGSWRANSIPRSNGSRHRRSGVGSDRGGRLWRRCELALCSKRHGSEQLRHDVRFGCTRAGGARCGLFAAGWPATPAGRDRRQRKQRRGCRSTVLCERLRLWAWPAGGSAAPERRRIMGGPGLRVRVFAGVVRRRHILPGGCSVPQACQGLRLAVSGLAGPLRRLVPASRRHIRRLVLRPHLCRRSAQLKQALRVGVVRLAFKLRGEQLRCEARSAKPHGARTQQCGAAHLQRGALAGLLLVQSRHRRLVRSLGAQPVLHPGLHARRQRQSAGGARCRGVPWLLPP